MAQKRKIGNDSALPGTSSNSEATSAKLYKDGGDIQADPARGNGEKQELLKKNVLVYWDMGNDLHSKKLFKEAKKTYAKALKCLEEITDGKFKNYYFWVMNFNIALELKELKEFQEALQFCNNSYSSNCHYRENDVLNLRGVIYSFLGQYQDAVKDFRKSFSLVSKIDTLDSLNRNLSFLKFQSSRFKFYQELRLNKNCTPEQIRNAIDKLRASLGNGKRVERNTDRLTKLACQAEVVLLNQELKAEYDKGTGVMNIEEYCAHKEFYQFQPF